MNVFDLQAKIGLDSSGFEKGLDKAGGLIKGIASGIGNMVKVGVAGFSAVSAGVAALGKAAVESYANFEQLAGGVSTLFGAQDMTIEEYAESVGKSVDEIRDKYDTLMQSQKTVMDNAANAYKTAGMSANEYMETVTSFSASLLQSLGGDTQAAADKANMAITDMSDNANKMGTSMEAIQNAYNGFAKQNYTMLDNLKLGYGGTGAEMERLMLDAEKLNDSFHASRDENGKLTMSYGEIVDAIHIVQDNMGITGTTAREAASTISGSLGMMKSSWENLITGIADDSQDFDTLINNFVESIDTVAGNIIPRVEVALKGVGKLVEKLAPTIMERLPDLLNNVLPVLVKSAGTLISTAGKAILDNADQLLLYVVDLLYKVREKLSSGNTFTKIIKSLVGTLAKRVPQIFSELLIIGQQIVKTLGDAVIENAPELLHAFSRLVSDAMDSIGVMVPILTEFAFNLIMIIGQAIMDNSEMLLDSALWIVDSIGTFLVENMPVMIPKITEMIAQLALMFSDPETIGTLVDAAIAITMALADGLITALPILIENAPIIVENIVTAITDNLPKLLDCAWELIKQFTEALLANLPLIIESGKKIIDSIMVGIVQAEMQLWDKVKEIRETMHERFKEMIDFAKTWGKDMIDNFIGGIKEKWENLKQTVSDVAQGIKDFLGFSEPKSGPLSNFHTYAPDMMDLYAKGIKDNTKKVTSQLESSMENVKGIFTDGAQGNAGGFASGANVYNINVATGTIANDYDARRAGRMISESLAELQAMENMSKGAV